MLEVFDKKEKIKWRDRIRTLDSSTFDDGGDGDDNGSDNNDYAGDSGGKNDGDDDDDDDDAATCSFAPFSATVSA